MQGGAFPIHAHSTPISPIPLPFTPFHSFQAKSLPRFRRKRIAFMLSADTNDHNKW